MMSFLPERLLPSLSSSLRLCIHTQSSNHVSIRADYDEENQQEARQTQHAFTLFKGTGPSASTPAENSVA